MQEQNKQESHHFGLEHSDLIQLKRWNTPTIYNGWEQITGQNRTKDAFNLEETRDFMPQMGPMIGYAVTLTIEPSNPQHKILNPNAYMEYLHYVAHSPGPKIVVVKDLDKSQIVGSFWGEVNSNVHKSLGCIGTITDGAIRDLDEMTNAGFKALAKRLCVGHAYPACVNWNCEVEVFGRKVQPGDLIHADKHGFIVIAPDEQSRLLEAVRFMDANECNTIIPAARDAVGHTKDEILESIHHSSKAFNQNIKEKFNRSGEF
ncbi:MAG: RraA family protein [Bacteroidetes bacterium]|nr:RraA family protein [Bacteroidota bacterium]